VIGPLFALRSPHQIAGFIIEASLRIEAIRKSERTSYFAEPAMQVQFSIVERDGKPHIQMTMGPDDARHPGLPEIQSAKLKSGLDAGIRLMRTASWLGLRNASGYSGPRTYSGHSLAMRGAFPCCQWERVTSFRATSRQRCTTGITRSLPSTAGIVSRMWLSRPLRQTCAQ
jgi:hypothetical protein